VSNKDSLSTSDIDGFSIKPSTSITMDKKLMESLLHSHFALGGFWFNWTEIKDIKLEDGQITVEYTESDS